MESIRLPATANLLIPRSDIIFKRNFSRKRNHEYCLSSHFLCLAAKGRGFGREQKKEKAGKLLSVQPKTRTREDPAIVGEFDGKSHNAVSDLQFVERLEAVRRSALQQRKSEENKVTQAIDYDTPIKSDQTIGLGTKVGVGIAVVVFGLVFALGDFLPLGSVNSDEEATVVEKKLTGQEKETLKRRLEQYEAALSVSPNDLSALEGVSVTAAKLGDYTKASSLLEKLTKERPKDADAYRLLGEVEYELKDYERSVAAYRNSLLVSERINLESLSGLTNALLAAKKPNEAVQLLLSTRENLNSDKLDPNILRDADDNLDKVQKVDPIQVYMLLAKAYSSWGHIGDAVAVYDQVISMHPNDFRGYLAKGIILKQNGKAGDAERMFIQARFFAPEKVKAFVDRYSS